MNSKSPFLYLLAGGLWLGGCAQAGSSVNMPTQPAQPYKTAIAKVTVMPTATSNMMRANPIPQPTMTTTATSSLPGEGDSKSLLPGQVIGRRLFVGNCNGCHGEYGQGSGEAPPIAKTSRTLEEVRVQIRHPLHFMRNFSESEITDEEIGHIYSYLQVLETPRR